MARKGWWLPLEKDLRYIEFQGGNDGLFVDVAAYSRAF